MENNNQEKRHFLSRMLTKTKKKKDSLTLLIEMIDACDDCLDPLRTFSEKQLSQATNNYDSHHLLHTSDDGWYNWYKGSLEGQIVSIKKAVDNPELQLPKLDLAINNIAMAVEMNSHVNSLKIIGLCLQTQIPIIVYEFAKNGTLSDCIHNIQSQQPLPWKSRLRIASEIATTVAYLHTAFQTPILHRDINPSNVFLDRHCVAKISDFSLSISLPKGETQLELEVEGTIEYLSPEYMSRGIETVKSDVFSFGVLLFELLTGKQASKIVRLAHDDQSPFFQYYLKKFLQSDEVNLILDPMIMEEGGQVDVQQQVQAVSGLALRCLEANVDERPTMVAVTNQLNEIAKLYSHKTSQYNYGHSLRINWEIQEQLAMHTPYKKQEKRHHFLRYLTRLKKSSSNNRSTLLLEEMIGSCSVNYDPIRIFSAKELEQATNNYDSKHLLHPDDKCKWYKGNLHGHYISVKKVQGNYWASNLHYVINDIVIALHMNTHKNVLKLIGICLETPIPIQVYECAKNRKLSDHICTSSEAHPQPLLWKSRLRIAMEIAQTVAYLHTAFCSPIIHRDIKPSYVFLDQYNVAKLADFSLAIEIPKGDTHVEDAVRGTIGYIAPEYLSTGTVREKNDVFSFGMLLLELLTGKRPFDLARLANDDDVMLLDYFKNHLRSNEVNRILDPAILEEDSITDVQQQVQAVSWLALRCTDSNVEERPTMMDVAYQLDQIAELNPLALANDKYGQSPTVWEVFE